MLMSIKNNMVHAEEITVWQQVNDIIQYHHWETVLHHIFHTSQLIHGYTVNFKINIKSHNELTTDTAQFRMKTKLSFVLWDIIILILHHYGQNNSAVGQCTVKLRGKLIHFFYFKLGILNWNVWGMSEILYGFLNTVIAHFPNISIFTRMKVLTNWELDVFSSLIILWGSVETYKQHHVGT